MREYEGVQVFEEKYAHFNTKLHPSGILLVEPVGRSILTPWQGENLREIISVSQDAEVYNFLLAMQRVTGILSGGLLDLMFARQQAIQAGGELKIYGLKPQRTTPLHNPESLGIENFASLEEGILSFEVKQQ